MMMRNIISPLDRLRCILLPVVLLALAVPLAPAVQAQGPETIAYQGYLTDADGTPLDGTADLTFRLYEGATGGSALWEEAQSGVAVSGGVFAVQLGSVAPIEDVAFDRPLWLALRVDAGEELAPRVPLTAVPYSLRAGSLDDAALEAGDNVNIERNGQTLVISAADSDSDGGGTVWRLGGNPSTDPETDFLGTTDGTPLEIKVNDARVMRYEPETVEDGPNVIGGWSGNRTTDGVMGATIAGGGDPDFLGGGPKPNRVEAGYGAIGGGIGNTTSGLRATVSGGDSNTASGSAAAVGGGIDNTASNSNTTVGGGLRNTASQPGASVIGGYDNTASGIYATVGGGENNLANGFSATVPGGNRNWATGTYSFAAGRRAHAKHNGTFVWADSDGDAQPEGTPFFSTSPDQFLIRAGGGVGIGTTAPSSPLTVAGMVESTDGGFKLPDGTVIDSASDLGSGGTTTLPEPLFINDENVGVGTKEPSSPLTVAGMIESTEGGFQLPDGTVLDEKSDLAGNGALSEAIATDGKGNVGIGTSTPARRLSVRDANHQLEIVDSANEKNWTVTTIGNQDLGVYEDGSTSRMMIETGGKVGIGTNNPSDRLQVDAEAGEDALRVRVDGTTRLRVHDNGGVSVGVNAGPPPGGLLVEGDIKLNQPQTRWYSVVGSDFAYTGHDQGLLPGNHTISLNGVVSCKGGGLLWCGPMVSVHLPHGAKVTELSAKVKDEVAAEYVRVQLKAKPHLTGNTVGLVNITSEGLIGKNLIISDDQVNSIIDNEKYVYVLQLSIPQGPGYSLSSIRITYTITSPLP